MADAAPEGNEETPAKGKKPIILFGAIVVLAVSASVGGTMYFMQGAEPAETAAEPAAPTEATAIYHSIRPAFVVNFLTENKSRYLQADITLMSRNEAAVEAVVEHGPLVRSEILQYLADQNFTQLRTDEGKEAIREQLKELLNKALSEEAGTGGIETVLLTNFVLQ